MKGPSDGVKSPMKKKIKSCRYKRNYEETKHGEEERRGKRISDAVESPING